VPRQARPPEHRSTVRLLRWAVAAGAAALLNPGTELCLPGDVKRLAEAVIVESA